MKNVERMRVFFRKQVAALTPSETAWYGASLGLYTLVAAIVTAFFVFLFLQDFSIHKLPAFFVLTGAAFLAGLLVLLTYKLIGRLASSYRVALLVFTPFIFIAFAPGDSLQKSIFGGALVIIASLLGAGFTVIARDGFAPSRQKVTLAVTMLGIAGLAYGLHAVFGEKESANPLLDDYVLADRTLSFPNPGLSGTEKVLTLNYGSGKDSHRPEYGTGSDIIARTVDGSKFIDNWEGVTGWLRSNYWGFDATQLPLQARVWYPEGEGPFPLALVVHGNHAMEDYSDAGYAYLGELYASRGIIFASVDQNFMNFSISSLLDLTSDRPGLQEENDARGWLMLQHLVQWRDWNQQPGHIFEKKIDMDRIALIGHSRGGEAVAIAAAFNQLERYPDDATLAFDFNFNIRGVIAIAPIDGQYKPRGTGTPIQDVNYFTIHGSMDGDVQSFEGTSQYSRVVFTKPDNFHFRSSLYVTGANHGQFNTSWNNMDSSWFDAWALDLNGIMHGEEQRTIAKVYFGAFLEIVLRDKEEYLPIFTDARYAAAWLPDRFYINQYSSSKQTAIADFEEDIDPVTNSLSGGKIETENLSKWYEIRNSLKWDDLDTHSMVAAWDSEFTTDTASVSFSIPHSSRNNYDSMSISLSTADTNTLPSDWPPADKPAATSVPDTKDEAPLDWTIVLTDGNGKKASLPLSHDSELYPLVKAVPRRADFLESEETTEILFRRFEFLFREFNKVSAKFDSNNIAQISFVFDRSKKGAIIIDDLSVTANAAD